MWSKRCRCDLQTHSISLRFTLSDRLDGSYSCVYVLELRFSLSFFFFFFFWVQPAIVDFVNCEKCIRALFTVPQITLFNNFFIKNGSTTLFTHLKIISLQYFQFQFSVSAKISSIQTHPKCPLPEFQLNSIFQLKFLAITLLFFFSIHLLLLLCLLFINGECFNILFYFFIFGATMGSGLCQSKGPL